MRFYWEVLATLSMIHQQASMMGVEIFENKTLLQSLHDTEFDVVLIDPGLPVGVLVAHELKLPTVFNVRWVTAGNGHFVVAPSPTSYVPISGNAMSDRMTFAQRLKNTLYYFLNTCIDRYVVCPHYNRLVEKFFGSDLVQMVHFCKVQTTGSSGWISFLNSLDPPCRMLPILAVFSVSLQSRYCQSWRTLFRVQEITALF